MALGLLPSMRMKALLAALLVLSVLETAAPVIAQAPADQVETRVLGLPVTAVTVIGGVVIALAVVAGLVVPMLRRGPRGRGNGTYGRQGSLGDRASRPR